MELVHISEAIGPLSDKPTGLCGSGAEAAGRVPASSSKKGWGVRRKHGSWVAVGGEGLACAMLGELPSR